MYRFKPSCYPVYDCGYAQLSPDQEDKINNCTLMLVTGMQDQLYLIEQPIVVKQEIGNSWEDAIEAPYARQLIRPQSMHDVYNPKFELLRNLEPEYTDWHSHLRYKEHLPIFLDSIIADKLAADVGSPVVHTSYFLSKMVIGCQRNTKSA